MSASRDLSTGLSDQKSVELRLLFCRQIGPRDQQRSDTSDTSDSRMVLLSRDQGLELSHV